MATKRVLRYITRSFVLLLVIALFSTCNKKTALSPARSLAGTWKTTGKVKINELTNCNSSSLYAYTSFQAYVTFIITAVDDNTVIVDIYLSSKSGLADACLETPPIEDGPVKYGGKISSSALTITDQVYGKNTSGNIVFGTFDVGDFTFTTDLLTGKIFWLQYYSSLDIIGWETEQVSLSRQ